jgi:hypothetical protein
VVAARERTRTDPAELAQERAESELAASQIARSEAEADAAELREVGQKAESDPECRCGNCDGSASIGARNRPGFGVEGGLY